MNLPGCSWVPKCHASNVKAEYPDPPQTEIYWIFFQQWTRFQDLQIHCQDFQIRRQDSQILSQHEHLCKVDHLGGKNLVGENHGCNAAAGHEEAAQSYHCTNLVEREFGEFQPGLFILACLFLFPSITITWVAREFIP